MSNTFAFMYSRHPAFRQRLHVAPSDVEPRELTAACGRRLVNPYVLRLDPDEYSELTNLEGGYRIGHILDPCVECGVTVTRAWSWITEGVSYEDRR